MNSKNSENLLQRWQTLFNQLEVIERGNTLTYSESKLLEFEVQNNIILPCGYKEFCQIFSAGYFGDFVEILGCPNINYSKNTIKNYRQALEWELERQKEDGVEWFAPEDVKAIQKIFDSALVFAKTFTSEIFVWDLTTYSDSDQSYDIYFIRIDHVPAYFVGRDFVEFVRDFCLGMKAFELLPQGIWPDPQEINSTFTRWGVINVN
jgi:hypothetical protein